MKSVEPTKVPSFDSENNLESNVLADEIVVLAERGSVVIGSSLNFTSSVQPLPASLGEQASRVWSIEIPLVGDDGRISEVLCRDVPIAERSEPAGQSGYELAKVFIHDINNVLSIIGGGLRLLERQGDAVARETIFKRMRQAIERGAALSRNLLNAGKHPSPPPSDFTSRAYLADAAETLLHALDERTLLDVKISSDLWDFNANPEKLYFALLNLCRNADAAMLDGGMLTITANNVDPLPAAPRGAVVISVADTGAGMSEKVLARAFEPYYTTKATGDGTGLGLCQVRDFVEHSGGAIRLESAVGVGTTVRMVFPRAFSEARRDFDLPRVISSRLD